MGIRAPIVNSLLLPHSSAKPWAPKGDVAHLSFIFFFFLRKKTQTFFPDSVLLCGMAIFVHLCWMFRVLYLGPILLSFTESEKTLPRNHLKIWTSRHLPRMRNFLYCKLILAKEVLWPSCLSLVINAAPQTLQKLKHSSTWLYQLLQILFCKEKFTTVFQVVFQNPHPN